MSRKAATFLIPLLVALTLILSAAFTDGTTPAFSATTETSDSFLGGDGGKISLDVRNVDLRDILSALAVNLGANIILLETKPVQIDFQMENITARQALELIVQGQGLAYLQNGNFIVVGEPGKLKGDFFNQMILVKFDLFYIPAQEISELLGELGIDQTNIMVDTNPRAIWIQGTAQSLQKVQQLIYAVDTEENQLSLDYKTLTTTHISPDRVVELLARVGIELKRYVELDNRLLVFDRELFPHWEPVQKLVQQLDGPAANEQKAFVYHLNNIVAGDAAARLNEFGFDEVKAITYNYDRLGKELLVICPPHLETRVRSALVSLDQTRQKIRVPVHTEKSENARTRVYAMRDLVSELSGVSLSDLHISRNLTGDSNNPEYVLWVEETPDKIQLVKDLIDEMKSSQG